MQLPSLRLWAFVVGFTVQCGAYPGWPMYPQPQPSHEYQDDDYYYAPKVQYYYDNPAVNAPDAYGQVPQYPYFYDPYGHFTNEAPKRQEERFAALPIGQETWFESDASPHWRANDVDDVSAAFLDNLILTQMAQDAQRRRENARAAFPNADYEERNVEDEDVRELKALAGKPLYHVPKTVPKIEDEEYDYPNDEGFINWDGGNKRSVTTTAPVTTTTQKAGQAEIMVPRPANSHKHQSDENKRASAFFGRLSKLLQEKESMNTQSENLAKSRKINKRFVAGDSDLVLELRGLKHRIPT